MVYLLSVTALSLSKQPSSDHASEVSQRVNRAYDSQTSLSLAL